MKVCFETFGCRLNRAEALEEEAKYVAEGWTVVTTHAEAQVIVVRGCSVTARAQRDCEHLVDHLKEKYPHKRIVVEGCLPAAQKAKAPRSASGPAADGEVPVPTRTARAYLKIQDGCNGACTFCIVPTFRGRSVSVPFDDVLSRARRFLAAGYRELVLTGCNLTAYVSEDRRLPELLEAVARCCEEAVPPARVRLGSVEPGPLAHEVVQVMARHACICNYLHLPVQTGSARLLLSMRRPYMIRQVDQLVAEAQRLMPDLGLGYDLMSGYPDELDSDHQATLAFLQRHRFNKAHVFPYSERPGTVAAAFPGAVPKELRHARAHELARLADEARSQFARRFKGRIVEVVVEDEKLVAGWTAEYLWCQVGKARPGVRRRDLVRIRVLHVDGHRLSGELA